MFDLLFKPVSASDNFCLNLKPQLFYQKYLQNSGFSLPSTPSQCLLSPTSPQLFSLVHFPLSIASKFPSAQAFRWMTLPDLLFSFLGLSSLEAGREWFHGTGMVQQMHTHRGREIPCYGGDRVVLGTTSSGSKCLEWEVRTEAFLEKHRNVWSKQEEKWEREEMGEE